MYYVNNLPTTIEIGYTGETNFRTIQIDMSAWMEIMPSGIPSIVHIRPGEDMEDAYIAGTTFENNILTWTIQASDIGPYEGTGLAQVWLEENQNSSLDKVGMSAVFATVVRQAVSDMGKETPSAQIPWMQQMTALKNQTIGAREAAETAQTAAEAAAYAAAEAATAAGPNALISEGYAVGKQHEVPVESGPYWHNNSQYYCEEAASSATDAETAQGKAEDAKTAAETAQGKAEDAQTAAETAQGKAEDAQTAAETAQGKAEDAQEAAETAQGAAEDAQDAAEDAQTAAETAQSAAEAAAATASAAYNVNLLAPNFVQGTANANGSHVISNGGYYELPNGHTAGETWENTTKKQTTVGEEITDVKSAIVSENTEINYLHSLVNYGYNTSVDLAENSSSTTGTRIGIKRSGVTVTLNGENTIGAAIYIRLNGTPTRTRDDQAVKTWNSDLFAPASGKKFRIITELLSGTSSLNNLGVSVYKTGTNSTIGTSYIDENGRYNIEFTADGSGYNICLYITPSTEFINAEYIIYMEDITESIQSCEQVRKSLVQEYANILNIEQGYYAIGDGSTVYSTSWCRTNKFVNKDLLIQTTTSYMWLNAFNKNTGEYVGGWDGTQFSTTYNSNLKVRLYNIADFVRNYPNYMFVISFKRQSGNVTPSDIYSELYVSSVTEKGISAAESVIETQDSLVNYNYDYPGTAFADPTSDDAGRVGISRYKEMITLTGDTVITEDIGTRIRLNGNLSRTNYADRLGTGISFKNGHKYQLTLTRISGMCKKNGEDFIPRLVLYKTGSSSATSGEVIEDIGMGVSSQVIVLDNSTYNVCLYIQRNVVFTDFKCTATIKDLTVEGFVDSLDDGSVQSYYIDELNDTVSKVRAINNEPALVFPVVTDIHRYYDPVQSFKSMVNNMKAFCEKVKCDFIVNTGDTINGDKTQATSLKQVYDTVSDFAKMGLPFMYAEGNHDNNPYSSGSAYVFNLKQIFSAFYSATKDVFYNISENGTDYYIDFVNMGVRLISLNSCNVKKAVNYGYGDSTANWLESALETDFLVVVVTHVSPYPAHTWNNTNPANNSYIRNKLESFVNNGGKLIIITGHSHIDAEFIEPFAEITNVCQLFQKADITGEGYPLINGMIDGIRNPDRTQNTYTEDAWTVVVLKPAAEEIDFIRFGAGVDRYIHYEPVGTGTVTSRLDTPTWSSSDTSVATVSDGVISAVGSGKCAIMAKDATGNIEVWIVAVS